MKRNHKQRQKGLGVSSGARHWIAVKCRIQRHSYPRASEFRYYPNSGRIAVIHYRGRIFC